MSRTNWLSWLKNRSRSQNFGRRRRNSVLLGGIRDWLLEDRCLLNGATMPTVTVNDQPQPTSIYVGNNQYYITNNVKTNANDVLLISGTGLASGSYNWGTVPQKLFTFTNNNPKGGATIYPFLYDANNIKMFDPADPLQQEYRLYVGYKDGGKD
jgi:hypothetical protein